VNVCKVFSPNHPITADLGLSIPISLVKLLSHTTWKNETKLTDSDLDYVSLF